MVQIAPSMLSADYAALRRDVEELEKAVPTSFIGILWTDIMCRTSLSAPESSNSCGPYSKLPFDVHLMVTNPDEMIPWFVSAGADIITVHAEVCPHLDRTLEVIRSCGCRAGVSLNPSTSEEALKYVLDKLDMVLVMTVNPGFGGQGFLDGQLEKIRRIKDMLGDRSVKVEVDGGINPMTAAECISVGADILVAGTSVFAGREFRKNIEALR